MEPNKKFLRSLIEVSLIEFQSYDFHRLQIIFSSGLSQRVLGYSKDEFYKLSRNFYEGMIHPDDIPKVHEAIEKISGKIKKAKNASSLDEVKNIMNTFKT